MLRILFVADGRSPIALNWMNYFLDASGGQDFEVHLVSTFPCTMDARLASFHLVPVAFSSVKKTPAPAGLTAPGSAPKTQKTGGLWSARAVGLRTAVRQWLGPFTLPRAAHSLRCILAEVQPHLIHAMRIPYEGMLAAQAQPAAPLLVSIWGNDFTLHAPSTPWMRRETRRTLAAAAAIHADCHRDVRLAHAWGFPPHGLSTVLPGAGGVQLQWFYPAQEPVLEPIILQPRGIRAYIDNEAFFRAAHQVLQHQPQARFLCPTMAGDSQAQHWVNKWGLAGSVELLPHLTRSQMADLFRQARLVVSPATHDGTPNTLLEAMACGCLPVAGDLESLREWITPGVNGLLVDLHDPDSLAQAILVALQSPQLSAQARQINPALIASRAEYHLVMQKASEFYQALRA
jgi:glycosyltransferase involved in cell wall biosynthesis